MSIKIGRRSDLDYVIADPTVSRQHAELKSNGIGGWRIRDVGSSSGTFLISSDGSAHQVSETDVRTSDVLVFGSVHVAVADIIRVAKSPKYNQESSSGVRLIRCGCGAVKREGGACGVCGKA
jgi:pSer/pThr/pTyr-binding forkhead associated (FHA) protein